MRGQAGKMFRLSYDSFANAKLIQNFANEVRKSILKKSIIVTKPLLRCTLFLNIIW